MQNRVVYVVFVALLGPIRLLYGRRLEEVSQIPLEELLLANNAPRPFVVDEDLSLEADEILWNNQISTVLDNHGHISLKESLSLIDKELGHGNYKGSIPVIDALIVTPDNDLHQRSDGRFTDEQGGHKMCEPCVKFGEKALNSLEQIILKGGVAGCAELCSALPLPPVAIMTCNIFCDVVGIKKFANIVKKADLDAIYYCQLLDACPYNDHGDATITEAQVAPKEGPQGTFDLDIKFMTENGTSIGELYIYIQTVDKLPVGSLFLMKGQPTGTYGTNLKIKAVPSKSCDPTKEPCERWLPGDYQVKIALCAGKCGSKHPHSQIYDTRTTNFTLTFK